MSLLKLSNYDLIIAELKNPDGDASNLSLHQQTLLARWQEAFTLQRNGHSTADSAALLMKRFPGISRATAYRDCANALSLFGDIAQSTKQGIKHLATEIVKDAIGIARIKNNEVAMIQGAKEMASINGVNTIDPDLPDFSKLEPNTYNISLPQNVISALQSMITGGHINLGGLVNEMSKHAQEAEIIQEDESD